MKIFPLCLSYQWPYRLRLLNKMNISIQTKLKKALRSVPLLWRINALLKSSQIEQQYCQRRENYYSIIQARKITPQQISHITANANNSRIFKKLGQIHTFLIFRNTSWQNSLLLELKKLGPVTVMDFHEDGTDEKIAKSLRGWEMSRKNKNEETIRLFEKAHAANPVDWLFCYFDGRFVLKSTIERIKYKSSIPTVLMGLDDKQSWDGPRYGEQRSGSIDIGGAFDLCWTSARTTVDWFNALGTKGYYAPEGFSIDEYHPLNMQPDIPVSFVGACYGPRLDLIKYLFNHGVPIKVYGKDWGKLGSRFAGSPNEIFNRSIINLGCGYVLHSQNITNVKGRDFDIPGAGGGVYLTTFNSDLAQHFDIGREILCYHSFDECLELIRWYLQRPEICRNMAKKAYERSIREHRWLHRYTEMLQKLGIVSEQ
jgi:spore maturation protein CgeB